MVEVRDEFDNLAVGAEVSFFGAGSADPAVPVADANGQVSTVWTLGTVAGPQILEIEAGSVLGATAATAAPGPPAVVEAVSGDAQQTYAGLALAEAIAVRVIDDFGNVVPEASVAFVVTTGGGSAAPADVVTTDEGLAQSTWTLGPTLGAHTLEARVVGAESASFTADAPSGPPAAVVATAGADQNAEVASELPVRVEVEVQDSGGNPVPGATVVFGLTGGGSIDVTSAVTEAPGRASTLWTLGTLAGTQTLQASVTGVATLSVTATAVAGPAAAIAKFAGDGQSPVINTAATVDPSVRISDAFGNPVADVTVTFAVTSGGGSVAGATPITGTDGIAAIQSWTMGSSAGANTLTAAAAGLADVTFDATAVLTPVYDVEIRFAGTPPSASQQAAFSSAAARWEQIVTGDVADISAVFGAGACGVSHPAVNEVIDDLLVFVEVVAIDGPGGVLGSAGPCFIRTANGLTIVGSIKLDVADVAQLEVSGGLEDVIVHEMGHVVGVGTLDGWYDVLVDRGLPDPHFPGAEAVSRYAAAGGVAVNAVPVANTGGSGTRDAHWREAHMGRELMTGFLNSGITNPLSAITIGAVQDIGYVVDFSAADAYTVFPGALRIPGELIQLTEIPTPPPIAIDSEGRIGPRRR